MLPEPEAGDFVELILVYILIAFLLVTFQLLDVAPLYYLLADPSGHTV
jgi:hypothetical protein